MGDVKRYEPIACEAWAMAEMVEMSDTSSAPGWYAQADYARLEREHAADHAELTRLRAVEAAAEVVVKEFRSVWRKGDYDLTDAERASLIGLIRVLRPERENEFTDD